MLNTKSIKRKIQTKFNDFLDSIDDPKVKTLVKENTIITGGCITSYFLNEKVNDFDLYFKDYKTALEVTKYYVNKFNSMKVSDKFTKTHTPVEVSSDDSLKTLKVVIQSAGIASIEPEKSNYQYFENTSGEEAEEAEEYVDNVTQTLDVADQTDGETIDNTEVPSYSPIFLSSNAITLSNKIQIIIRFFGEPKEIHKNYDFIHCQNYWTSWDNKLALKKKALESLLNKELVYTGSKYPICSIIRLRKFIKRGWWISAGQILKIAMQTSELDLTNVKVLEDQLTGVDVAYFHEIIEIFKKADKKGKKIDATYVCSIIDRIF